MPINPILKIDMFCVGFFIIPHGKSKSEPTNHECFQLHQFNVQIFGSVLEIEWTLIFEDIFPLKL